MYGLAYLMAFAVYLAISIGVIIITVWWAKKRGRRPILWGIIAGLAMYNLVFWDYIPTLVVFKYYCQTRSGFWVYKTPEQWKLENPGIAKTLTWRKKSQKHESSDITRGYKLNERIGWVFIEHHMPVFPVTTKEELIMDLKNDEILVKRVKIYSGYSSSSGELRFWTHMRQPMFKREEFDAFWDSYKKLGTEVK